MSDCVLFSWWNPNSNPGKYTLTLIILLILCILRELILYIGKWFELKVLYPDKFKIISNKFWITNKDVKSLKNKISLKNNHKSKPMKAIKSLKDKMNKKKIMLDSNPLTSPIASDDEQEIEQDINIQIISTNTGQIWFNDGYPFILRISDGITFGISLLLGYWLMLIVMTYNWGYFITICLGFIIGRIIFYGQTKNLQMCLSIRDQHEEDGVSSEACH